MKPRLLFADRDLVLGNYPSAEVRALFADLQLASLLDAMAAGDELVSRVATQLLGVGLDAPAEVEYRQRVLDDCVRNASAVRELYALALASRKNRYAMPSVGGRVGAFRNILGSLESLVVSLRTLRGFVRAHASDFRSDAFRHLYSMLELTLSDRFLAALDTTLDALRPEQGVVLGMRLGPGNQGVDYSLHAARARPSWWQARRRPSAPQLSFDIAPQDEGGRRALAEVTDRGVATATSVLGDVVDRVDAFFATLAHELAFYVGCLNLRERLLELGESVSPPDAVGWEPPTLSFAGLYDVALTLRTGQRLVGASVDADDRSLVVVTGANSGGKSTLLRAIGTACLMMRAGMFVGAREFRSSVGGGVFTHFLRAEDATMQHGKLDEELTRMSTLVDRLAPRSLVLFNESFSTTDEESGAAIAHGVVTTLLESEMRVVYVTHQFSLANRLYEERRSDGLFLRADRDACGRRTFRFLESPPLATSFGIDLYRRLGGFAPTHPDESEAR